jgi:hypothetical protein
MFPTPLLKPAVAGSAYAISNDARSERLYYEHRKLAIRARNFAYAHPGLVVLGEDPLVEHLASSHGFSSVDLVILRLLARGGAVTAIGVPTRIWRDDDSRSRLHQIKREARSDQSRCILVTQRWLKAPVRSKVSQAIAQSQGVGFTREQVELVLAHLRTMRISTLIEAAAVLVGHRDPISAVLAMTAKGLVDIDRSMPLSVRTWVSTRS